MERLFIPRKDYLVRSEGGPIPDTAPRDELSNYLAIEHWAANIQSALSVVFDMPGPVVVSVTDLWCPPLDVNLSLACVGLTVPGSTNTTCGLMKNSIVVATFAMPAGANIHLFQFTTSLLGGVDFLQAFVSGVGTGSSGLTMSVS